MKQLFEINNISLQEIIDENGLKSYMAYTEDLLNKNILIEFFDAGPGETGTAISAISCDTIRSYTFALSVTVQAAIQPLPVYRLVADAIDFIKKCNHETVLSELVAISTNVWKSDEFKDRKKGAKIYQQNASKFNNAMALIKEKRNILIA